MRRELGLAVVLWLTIASLIQAEATKEIYNDAGLYPGTNLLVLLEKRLDNVVYRSGLATTKQAARQLVNHGHFAVNGKNLDIPSYTVRVGDTIAVKETKRNSGYWKSVLENTKKTEIPGWLTVDPKALSIRIVSEPKPEELPQNIELSLIVEFYSR